MTSEMKTIRRSLESASSFEQFKKNLLSNIGCGSTEHTPVNMEHEIRKLMAEIGVRDHLSGYRFIECAVNLAIQDGDYLDNITGRLYTDIAKKFDTYPSRVERAIRHAIERAFSSCDPDVLSSYFGNTISCNTGKATNGQFIARMVNIIRDRM